MNELLKPNTRNKEEPWTSEGFLRLKMGADYVPGVLILTRHIFLLLQRIELLARPLVTVRFHLFHPCVNTD